MSVEERYIRQIDSNKIPPIEKVGNQGLPAQEAVLEFFKTLPGITIRLSTPAEDSGLEQIGKDLAIDAVGYMKGKPVFVLQITTATDSKARKDKEKDRLNRPFIRLSEMNKTDPAIPRLLIFLEAKEVAEFMKDRDFSKHSKLMKQIIDGYINNLKLSLLQTKLPKEQALLNELLELMEKYDQQKSRPD